MKVALAIGLVVYLFASGRIDLDLLLHAARPSDFAGALIVWAIGFLITVLRWQYLLITLGVQVRTRDAARLGWLGLFFSQLIPGATGGDLVRGVQAARERPQQRPQAILSVLLDRTMGLTALMIIGAVGIFFCPPEVRGDPLLRRLGVILLVAISVILLGGALLCWRGFWQRIGIGRAFAWLPGRRIVVRLGEALWAMRRRRVSLGIGLLLSFLGHGCFIAAAMLLARGMTGSMPSVANYFFLVPVGQLAFSLPLTPGGSGVGQWAFDELFLAVGETHGAELGVLLQLIAVFWAIAGLGLFRGRGELAEDWAIAVSGREPGARPAPGNATPPESAPPG